MQEKNKKLYLTLTLGKSNITQDVDEDYIFDVEASNENLDLDGQKVLQSALLESKNYFLTNGVISKDHLHIQAIGDKQNKKIIRDESYIIGEPLEVYTRGYSTRVKGKLYKNNEYAKKFINLLKAGSSRVKASVGGFLPVIKKRTENGEIIEEVISMLWNDLALTISPVNPTVEPAYILQRSFNGLVLKALSAGYGTDSATFTSGRAMIPEDLEGAKTVKFLDDDILLFLSEVMKGNIKNTEDAQAFLFNTNQKQSLAEVIKIVEDNKQLLKLEEDLFMALIELFPFLKKSTENEKNENEKKKQEATEGGDILENSNKDEDVNKDGDVIDATPVLKSLSDSIELLNKKIDDLSKNVSELTGNQEIIGKALAVNIDQVSKIAGTPNPRVSVVDSFGLVGKSNSVIPGVKKRHKQFTEEDISFFTPMLSKAVANGELSILECGKIESQINKSIQNASYQLDQKYIEFLERKLRETGVM